MKLLIKGDKKMKVKKIDEFKQIIILDKNKEIQINEIIEILVEKD